MIQTLMPVFNNPTHSEWINGFGFQINFLPESHDQERCAAGTG